MIKTLLWDFDNTLAFRNGMWSATVKELLDTNGYEHIAQSDISVHMQDWYPWSHSSKSHKELFKGKDWWEFIHSHIYSVLIKLNLSDDRARELAIQFRGAYLNLKKWSLFPDTIETLQRSKEMGFNNYIFSNHTPELDQLVEGLGLAYFINKTVSSALLEYEKPNLKFFKDAFVEIGEDPKDCVMIGDNYHADVEGSAQFGMPAILVHVDNHHHYKYYSRDLVNVFPIIEKLESDQR